MTGRGERIRPYPSRHLVGRDKFLQTATRRRADLCQVLEDRAQAPGSPASSAWSGFPWLTLLLGSGCLEVPAASAAVAEQLAGSVGAAILGVSPPQWYTEEYEAFVRDFTRSLVRDRLMSGRPGRSPEPESKGPAIAVSADAAWLVLAAALMTRLYHELATGIPRAMSRWDNDVAALTKRDSWPGLPAAMASIDDAEKLLSQLLEEFQSQRDGAAGLPGEILAAIVQLLTEMQEDLSSGGAERRLSVQKVRLLTEVAWYYLVRDTALYPGWTDLLLRLMLAEGDREAGKRSPRRPRPRYSSLSELADVARSILDRPTAESWAATTNGVEDELARQPFFRAAAELLWAQSEAHRMELPDSRSLPTPVAFTTTLDIELEMALAVTAGDRTFSVAVPVYVQAHLDANEAQFCWLACDVLPVSGSASGLSRIRQPSNWRLLNETSFLAARSAEAGHVPLVVHLSGSPLIDLPTPDRVTDALRAGLAATGIATSERSVFLPAITVDEYLAKQQSEAELSWLHRAPEDRKARAGRALPEQLTLPKPGADVTRYWLALGVPIADPAVRSRVLAQLGAVHRKAAEGAPDSADDPMAYEGADDVDGLGDNPYAPTPPPGGDTSPESHALTLKGAAVNLHIDDDEIVLLQWLGLDVVEASCHDFTRDLRHYALHVRAVADKRPPSNEACKLKEGTA